jgi:hypothetical protein
MTPITMDTLFTALEGAKEKANRDKEMQVLTGVYEDEQGEPHDPYQALEEMLVKALQEVRFLRLHQHVWSEDDRCSACGADGRA